LLSPLSAISPIDGRYFKSTEPLIPFFSEFGLIRYRLLVEVEYFIALCKTPLPQLKDFKGEDFKKLRDIYKNFSEKDAEKIKDLEAVTNHDVKAVEYFLRETFQKLGLDKYLEFIHFGLTSQDINNTAIPLSLKDALHNIYSLVLNEIRNKLFELSEEWKDIPMLAHTHGQAASPTRVGKEIRVFVERLDKALQKLKEVKFYGKFGGATGNMNAHYAAYSEIDWHGFAERFLKDELGLTRNRYTTQIDHYDDLAEIFDSLRRINVILIDFCRDMWLYISMGYFKQKIKKNEVGSSAMPHKVNPIDFENAEGNLGIANAIYDHLSNKLPISRLQRDLTDSTVLRNIGVPVAHSLISLSSIQKGISKIILDEARLKKDLEDNWLVISEAIQTILRREGYPNPYDKLKEFSRTNVHPSKENFDAFIKKLEVSDSVKKELLAITPFNYVGK
jgi:adenylosuccinate lyase